MLLKYYPGPALTLAYILIFRFSRFREMATMERSIRFFLLLLLSCVLMIFLISAHNAFYNSSTERLVPDLTEALNYLPALFLLNTLSVSCRKELTVTEKKIIYHNTDYTSLFNPLQLEMLQKLSKTSVIKCRDFAGPETDCPEDFCKATQCSEYNRIYRNVQDLGKKLVNIGPGQLVPPDNRRDVVSKGWKLLLNEGISLKQRKKAPGIISLKADTSLSVTSDRHPGGISETTGYWLVLPGAVFLSGYILKFLSVNQYGAVAIFLTEILLFSLPFILNRRNLFKTGILLFAFLLFSMFFLSLFFIDEYSAFILLNKHWSFLLLLLLINLRKWENQIHMKNFRSQASVILFWSVWFLLVTTTIFTNPPAYFSIAFQVLDRFLLYSLMVLSVLFYSLPRKRMDIKDASIHINGAPLAEGLSADNMQILIEFIQNIERKLSCKKLLRLVEPELESGLAVDYCENCKSSVCKPYKRLYKRVRTIKKYLETNGIGTIINMEREGHDPGPGWYLQLHEDVFLQ